MVVNSKTCKNTKSGERKMENCGSNSPRISIGRVSNNVEDKAKTPVGKKVQVAFT